MKMLLLSLSTLVLAACSSGGDSHPPTSTEEQEIVLAPYETLENGLPVVKTLHMGNLPKSKTKKIKIKNTLSVNLDFITGENGEIEMGFVGPDDAYAHETDCPASLAPNAMCEIRITVDPDETRSRDPRNVFYVNVQNIPDNYVFGQTGFIVQIISQVNQNPVVTDLAADITFDSRALATPAGFPYQGIGIRNELGAAIRDIKINLPPGYTFIYNACPDVLEAGEICEAGIYYAGPGATPASAQASLNATGSNGPISYSYDIMQSFSHSSVEP